MSKNHFTGKTAQIFVTTLIGLIIASFVLTTVGTGTFSTSPGDIAQIGDYTISPREYQRAYGQLQDQYNQIFKGQSIPKALIDSLSTSTLKRLESQKIILNLSDRLNLQVGDEEIKKIIQNQDYFHTDSQFDFNKYKDTLRASGFTPKTYELYIKESLRIEKFYRFFSLLQVSNNYAESVNKVKNTSISVSAAKVDRYSLRKFLNVSPEEITNYLDDQSHQAQLESLYREKKELYQKPAQYSYRTLFLSKLGKDEKKVKEKLESLKGKLRAENFAQMVQEHSEDKITKGLGGLSGPLPLKSIDEETRNILKGLKEGEISAFVENSLGHKAIYLETLEPKLEKTLKDQDVASELARIALQREKTEELEVLYQDIIDKVTKAMKLEDRASLVQICEKYELPLQQKTPLNRYSHKLGNMDFSKEHTIDLFREDDLSSVKVFDRVTHSIIAKKEELMPTPPLKAEVKDFNTEFQGFLSQKMIEDFQKKNPTLLNPSFQNNL